MHVSGLHEIECTVKLVHVFNRFADILAFIGGKIRVLMSNDENKLKGMFSYSLKIKMKNQI